MTTQSLQVVVLAAGLSTRYGRLKQLEHEGYLVQPHTSAGRIPTDKGYRYFVDHLTQPGRLDRATTRQVGEFFSAAPMGSVASKRGKSTSHKPVCWLAVSTSILQPMCGEPSSTVIRA